MGNGVNRKGMAREYARPTKDLGYKFSAYLRVLADISAYLRVWEKRGHYESTKLASSQPRQGCGAAGQAPAAEAKTGEAEKHQISDPTQPKRGISTLGNA